MENIFLDKLNANTLFTIIVPVYNVEKYLFDCLTSISNQTYINFEIIAVNDGSTDSSLKILEEYSSIDKRLRYITQENLGLLNARKAAIPLANGDYTIFIDSDDLIYENSLERLNKIIFLNNPDIITYQLTSFSNYGDIIKTDGIKITCKSKEKAEILDNLSTCEKLNSIVCKCIRTDLIKNIAYSKIPNVSHGEDLVQSTALLINAKKIVETNEILYLYRNNLLSISRVIKKSHFSDIVASRTFLIESLKSIKELTKNRSDNITNNFSEKVCDSLLTYNKQNKYSSIKDISNEINKSLIFNNVSVKNQKKIRNFFIIFLLKTNLIFFLTQFLRAWNKLLQLKSLNKIPFLQ